MYTQSQAEDVSSVGMRDFLRTLPEEEVHGLLKTTSAGLIAAQNVEEAIPTIIMYSDAVTLLNRRRVKKEFLVNYLISKKVQFSVTASKTSLCHTVLSFWGEHNFQALKFNEILAPKEAKPQQITPISPVSQTTVPVPSIPSAVHNFNIIGGSKRSQEDSTNKQVALINNSSLEDADDDEEAMDYEESISLRRNERQLGQKLGEEFARWFYGTVNGATEFGPNHFWPQCNLRIEYITHSSIEIKNVTEVFHNGPKCYDEMIKAINGRQIFLNPNLIPGVGVRGKINPHGLAQVVVCGTFLQQGNVTGVFEQVFGLMMDPAAENNYKVKFSLLKFRQGSHIIKGNDPPALCDSSLVGLVEEVDDDD